MDEVAFDRIVSIGQFMYILAGRDGCSGVQSQKLNRYHTASVDGCIRKKRRNFLWELRLLSDTVSVAGS